MLGQKHILTTHHYAIKLFFKSLNQSTYLACAYIYNTENFKSFFFEVTGDLMCYCILFLNLWRHMWQASKTQVMKQQIMMNERGWTGLSQTSFIKQWVVIFHSLLSHIKPDISPELRLFTNKGIS